jgi:uncharacterized repeat protein (TIGR01451 family)
MMKLIMKIRPLFKVIALSVILLLWPAWLLFPAQAAPDVTRPLPLSKTSATIPSAAPPTGLTVTGPAAGSVDVGYTFTATLSLGSTPVDYTWETTDQSLVEQEEAGLNDTASFTWQTAGTKVITVTATNSEGTMSQSYEVMIAHVPLDIVVVFDVSGSMNYETTCFDCWEKANPELDVVQNPWPTNGLVFPISLASVVQSDLCTADPASQPIPGLAGTFYLATEAEHYSENYPPQSWYFENRQPGQGFWVIQRSSTGEDNNSRNASAVDTRGAYIRAHPLTTYSQSSVSNNPQLQGMSYNDECFRAVTNYQCWKSNADDLGEPPPATMSQVPYVEYDFKPAWTDNTYIWARVQGAGVFAFAWNGFRPTTLTIWDKAFYWQGGLADNEVSWPAVQGGQFNTDVSDYTCGGSTCGDETGPISSRWRWVKLGSISTPDNTKQYTLRIYQGSTALSIDKILFTNYNGGNIQTSAIKNDGSLVGGGTVDSNFRNLLAQNGGKGPAATAGSATREACNICNPIFGQTVNPSQCSCIRNRTDTTNSNPDYPAGGTGLGCTALSTTTNQLIESDLYHDIDPLRSAKEAVKQFAMQLDARCDQLGLVAYNNITFDTSDRRSELQCIRWASKNDPVDGVRKCYDPSTNPISYTNVIRVVENQTISGSTNIGLGVLEGLEELGIAVNDDNGYTNSTCTSAVNDGRVCDRREKARKVLILMTDGVPNQSTGCSDAANNDLPWQGSVGTNSASYNCAIYYAREAARHNVRLYTIGMGPGINTDLLIAMATGTDPSVGPVYFESVGGQFYNAAKPSDLDIIFEELAQGQSCTPNLAISKSGPGTATANSPISYTLTIANYGPAGTGELLVTDTLPAGATYLGGGTLDENTVSWSLPDGLEPGEVTQTTFAVAATQTITNSDYGVWAVEGDGVKGMTPVTTLIEEMIGDLWELILPLILKEMDR